MPSSAWRLNRRSPVLHLFPRSGTGVPGVLHGRPLELRLDLLAGLVGRRIERGEKEAVQPPEGALDAVRAHDLLDAAHRGGMAATEGTRDLLAAHIDQLGMPVVNGRLEGARPP